jgi:hypothetical protein
VISVNWVYLGAAIGALGTAVYLRDTLRGTTKPNRVTWLLWAVAPLLAAAIEFDEGVGLRVLPTFMVGLMPLLVFVGSFHNPASVWKIRRFDYACGVMSVVGTVVWLVTRNGVLGISAAIAADFLAGIPTVMKSWTHPETETVHSYVGTVISMIILLLTIDHWTFEVAAFPVFIVCLGSVEVLLVGGKAGPWWRARRGDGASTDTDAKTALLDAGGLPDRKTGAIATEGSP